MNEANSLLNSLTAGMGNAESHIIVNPDRTVFVPEELREIAVQYDHNIETVTFDCPRYWDDIDMSVMQVCINYMRADGKPGCYIVNDVEVDSLEPGFMHFTWTLSRNATEIKGSLKFLICVKKTDKDGDLVNHWNSKLNTQMSISEGLECGAHIHERYPDVITQILTDLDAIKASGGGGGYVDLSNYYTKNEIDKKFESSPTRSEIGVELDTLEGNINKELSGKADRLTTYTKDEVNNLINSAISVALEGDY